VGRREEEKGRKGKKGKKGTLRFSLLSQTAFSSPNNKLKLPFHRKLLKEAQKGEGEKREERRRKRKGTTSPRDAGCIHNLSKYYSAPDAAPIQRGISQIEVEGKKEEKVLARPLAPSDTLLCVRLSSVHVQEKRGCGRRREKEKGRERKKGRERRRRTSYSSREYPPFPARVSAAKPERHHNVELRGKRKEGGKKGWRGETFKHSLIPFLQPVIS